jgi:hypothetical protein
MSRVPCQPGARRPRDTAPFALTPADHGRGFT